MISLPEFLLDRLGISASVLIIATCLSCVGWEVPELHYKHGTDGLPVDIETADESIVPQFPAVALAETTCIVTRTQPRWVWQEWAVSEHENLNRLGGHPSWVQGAAYPTCRGCQAPMGFLLQLDSDLPCAEETTTTGFAWGSGGVGYVFWCDVCKHSAVLYQCT